MAETDNESSSADDSFKEEEEVDSSSDEQESANHHQECPIDASKNVASGPVPIQDLDLVRAVVRNLFPCFCITERYDPELSNSPSLIDRLSLGDCHGNEPRRLELDDSNRNAWNSFTECVGNIECLKSLKLGGYTLYSEEMLELVQSCSDVGEISVHLPVFSLMLEADGIRSLAQALSNHSCQAISLEINGTLPDAASDTIRNANNVVDSEILSLLLRVDGLKELSLHSLNLSIEHCNVVADMLSAQTCHIDFLHMTSCTFQGGGRVIAESLVQHAALKRFHLTDMLSIDNEEFRDSLVASLPSNQSIEECHITYLDQVDWRPTIVNLVQNIARLNTVMTSLVVKVPIYSPGLNQQQEDDLHQALQQNYTLQHVRIQNEEKCSVITTLNRAGRRYIRENASDKQKCIDVLTHRLVNHNIDCLYHHLQENPVLMITATSRGTHENKKRASNPLERRAKKAKSSTAF